MKYSLGHIEEAVGLEREVAGSRDMGERKAEHPELRLP